MTIYLVLREMERYGSCWGEIVFMTADKEAAEKNKSSNIQKYHDELIISYRHRVEYHTKNGNWDKTPEEEASNIAHMRREADGSYYIQEWELDKKYTDEELAIIYPS